MKYFSGFSLKGEEEIFSSYLDKGDFTISGFSYGAQLAFEEAYYSTKRVEKLILLSPAFFQPQQKSFIRTQLRYFNNNNRDYIDQFILNTIYPSNINLNNYIKTGTKDELEALLSYKWDKKKIEELLARGTKIEVYLGSQDKIISSSEAFEFFSSLTTTYFIKGVGHCLR